MGFKRALLTGLAGGVAGFGEGLAAQAEAERREALAQREFDQRRDLAREEMAFRSGEAQADRDFRAGQAEIDRNFQAEEGRRARAAAAARSGGGGSRSSKPTTLSDGRVGEFRDGVFVQFKDEAGNPVNTQSASAGKDITLEDGTVGRPINGVFQPYVNEAGEPVKARTGNKGLPSPEELTDRFFRELDPLDYGSAEERLAEAQKLAQRTLAQRGGGAASSAPDYSSLKTEPEPHEGQPVYVVTTPQEAAMLPEGAFYRHPGTGQLLRRNATGFRGDRAN